MRICANNKVNSISPSSNLEASSASLSQLDSKIEKVKNKILNLQQKSLSQTLQIEELKVKSKEQGIHPNLAIHHRLGVRVSMEKGELGRLETQMFALQKTVCHQDAVIRKLQSQLENQ